MRRLALSAFSVIAIALTPLGAFAQFDGGPGDGDTSALVTGIVMQPTATPTPTATATSTATSTFTPTPTPTQTQTFTATPTQTTLPSATSTPSSTASPAPTASFSPSPTAVPTLTVTPLSTFTATPLPSATPSEVLPGDTVTFTIKDFGGNFVANAIVIVKGIGSFISDESGQVAITVPVSYARDSLTISVVKTGYTFPPFELSLDQVATTIAEGTINELPEACTTIDVTAERLAMDSTFSELANTLQTTVEQLLLKSSENPDLSDELQAFAQRISALFNTGQTISAYQLPTARLACSAAQECRRSTLQFSKHRYAIATTQMYRAGMRALALATNAELLPQKSAAQQSREVRLLRSLFLARLGRS